MTLREGRRDGKRRGVNVSIAVDPETGGLCNDGHGGRRRSQRLELRMRRLGRLVEHGPGALLVDGPVKRPQNRQQAQTVRLNVQ